MMTYDDIHCQMRHYFVKIQLCMLAGLHAECSLADLLLPFSLVMPFPALNPLLHIPLLILFSGMI